MVTGDLLYLKYLDSFRYVVLSDVVRKGILGEVAEHILCQLRHVSSATSS